jgi:hypothetical protein
MTNPDADDAPDRGRTPEQGPTPESSRTPERGGRLRRWLESDGEPRPYLQPYLAGALLGLVLFAAFFTTGNGLGASGGMNRLLVYVEDLVAAEHIDRVPYLITMAGGDRNPLDSWIVVLTLGTLVGGFVSARVNNRARIETGKGPHISVHRRWAFALIGGALMGYGARMARGCTSGQALSGGAVLSAGSWAFMLAVFAGGYALAYFLRRAWN